MRRIYCCPKKSLRRNLPGERPPQTYNMISPTIISTLPLFPQPYGGGTSAAPSGTGSFCPVTEIPRGNWPCARLWPNTATKAAAYPAHRSRSLSAPAYRACWKSFLLCCWTLFLQNPLPVFPWKSRAFPRQKRYSAATTGMSAILQSKPCSRNFPACYTSAPPTPTKAAPLLRNSAGTCCGGAMNTRLIFWKTIITESSVIFPLRSHPSRE